MEEGQRVIPALTIERSDRLGGFVVLEDSRILFVGRTRERCVVFVRNHLAGRLRWRGEFELADALQAGEVDPAEAVAVLEAWGAEADEGSR
jgi:hypothetical protein